MTASADQDQGAADATLRTTLVAGGTALVCDALDALGVRSHFLGPSISAMWNAPTIAGRALTMTCRALETDEPAGDRPYGALMDALSEDRSDMVLTIRAGDLLSGVWGELLSVAALARRIGGVVTDGLIRDRTGVEQSGLAVFAAGLSPLDSAGRQEFASFGEPIEIGGTPIATGDWIVADELGAVRIPAHLVDAVAQHSAAKAAAEDTVRAELAAGQNLGDVFERHGIL
jgi:regulator of RNase E activity RraA